MSRAVFSGYHLNESYLAGLSQGDVIMMHNAHHILRQYMKFLNVTIQAKATKQDFPVVMFFTLYRVVLATECVVEVLKCDHSNASN